MLNVVHLSHKIIIIYQYNPWAHRWHKFNNFVAVEIRLLHSQPFTNNHFHFLITVETATSQVLLQQSKISTPLMLCSCPLMCLANQCNHHGCPFNQFQTACSIFSHAALPLHTCLLVINKNGQMFYAQEINHTTKFFMRRPSVTHPCRCKPTYRLPPYSLPQRFLT
jgi:hypothetical protein